MAGFDCDVLVVGLGPVGAALSALLVDEGLSVIAIDKDTSVYPLPRAAHFDHEIMRLFQRLGVAEEILPQVRVALAYEFRNAKGQVLMKIDLAGGSPSGWSPSYMMHQPTVENALRARLAASPLVDIRLGWIFESLEQDEVGVTATLTSGEEVKQSVRARHLVACDGARSPVREALGISLDSYDFDEPWLVIDVAVKDASVLPAINLQICDPVRPTTCVLMGPGRHRWEFMLKPGETAEQVLDDGFILDLLKPWNCTGGVELERKAVYRFHGLVAKDWRRGRVLIAGDAAHQTPPFAGQGMCTGLRDAANLAWKLGLIARGEAEDALLDTYQAEREPAARAVIQLAIGMGRLVCTTDPEAAAARDADMLSNGGTPAPPPANGPLTAGLILPGSPAAGVYFPQPWADGLRLDDVLGPGSWMLSRQAETDPGPWTCASLGEPRLAAFRPALERWFNSHQASAVLVRPDRHVFGTGDPLALAQAYLGALKPQPALAAS